MLFEPLLPDPQHRAGLARACGANKAKGEAVVLGRLDSIKATHRDSKLFCHSVSNVEGEKKKTPHNVDVPKQVPQRLHAVAITTRT